MPDGLIKKQHTCNLQPSHFISAPEINKPESLICHDDIEALNLRLVRMYVLLASEEASIKSIKIMSELHCFFIGLFLVGYFIFCFKITLSFNCIGGQHRWKLSPLAAFNMVLFMICFGMRFHTSNSFFSNMYLLMNMLPDVCK